jgi:hypothetical protein
MRVLCVCQSMKDDYISTIGKKNLRIKRKNTIRLRIRNVKTHSDIFIGKLVYG